MFDQLPYDIHSEILGYIDYETYINILNTCKTLRTYYRTEEHVRKILKLHNHHANNENPQHTSGSDSDSDSYQGTDEFWTKLKDHNNIEYMLMRARMGKKQRIRLIEYFKMDKDKILRYAFMFERKSIISAYMNRIKMSHQAFYECCKKGDDDMVKIEFLKLTDTNRNNWNWGCRCACDAGLKGIIDGKKYGILKDLMCDDEMWKYYNAAEQTIKYVFDLSEIEAYKILKNQKHFNVNYYDTERNASWFSIAMLNGCMDLMVQFDDIEGLTGEIMLYDDKNIFDILKKFEKERKCDIVEAWLSKCDRNNGGYGDTTEMRWILDYSRHVVRD